MSEQWIPSLIEGQSNCIFCYYRPVEYRRPPNCHGCHRAKLYARKNMIVAEFKMFEELKEFLK